MKITNVPDMPTGLDRIVKRSDDILPGIEFAVLVCPLFEVFSQCTASDGHVIPINKFILVQECQDFCKIFFFFNTSVMLIEKKVVVLGIPPSL